MRTTKNILIAFVINLLFSVLEFFGGLITGSVAIISDSIHDLGDALSIGVSFFLEKKSKRQPDDKFTYGYIRFSVMGGLFTVTVLIISSVLVIVGSIRRLFNPIIIDYSGMIILAIVGVILNFIAAMFTRGDGSINQNAVNLHMLEDVLGWIVVLIGAIIMKFTDLHFIDPIMSIAVSLFILINAIKNLRNIIDLFLEKIPDGISVDEIKEHLMQINGVMDVHHIHVWSMDGYNRYATMHIVTDDDPGKIKHLIRDELAEHKISHVTLELENSGENCVDQYCSVSDTETSNQHHHHHVH